MVLQAMGELLIPGTGEYEDANLVRLGEYREAARVVSEPAIAGMVAHEVCLDPGLERMCSCATQPHAILIRSRLVEWI